MKALLVCLLFSLGLTAVGQRLVTVSPQSPQEIQLGDGDTLVAVFTLVVVVNYYESTEDFRIRATRVRSGQVENISKSLTRLRVSSSVGTKEVVLEPYRRTDDYLRNNDGLQIFRVATYVNSHPNLPATLEVYAETRGFFLPGDSVVIATEGMTIWQRYYQNQQWIAVLYGIPIPGVTTVRVSIIPPFRVTGVGVRNASVGEEMRLYTTGLPVARNSPQYFVEFNNQVDTPATVDGDGTFTFTVPNLTPGTYEVSSSVYGVDGNVYKLIAGRALTENSVSLLVQPPTRDGNNAAVSGGGGNGKQDAQFAGPSIEVGGSGGVGSGGGGGSSGEQIAGGGGGQPVVIQPPPEPRPPSELPGQEIALQESPWYRRGELPSGGTGWWCFVRPAAPLPEKVAVWWDSNWSGQYPVSVVGVNLDRTLIGFPLLPRVNHLWVERLQEIGRVRVFQPSDP